MAKKKAQDETIREGLLALEAAGIPVNEPSADLLPRLTQEFGKGRETDLAIVFLLGKLAHPSAAEALTALENNVSDKDLRKEIRRSLFKLSQKGVRLPERPKPQPPSPLLGSAPEIEGYMSAVDGAGGRLVWIAKPSPGHGLQVIQAMVSDREGLMRIGGAPIRRKELRQMEQDIKARHAISMISVPWEYADAVLYTAYEKSKASGRGDTEHFTQIRSLINSGKPKPQQHPIYAELPSEGLREGPWREQSRRLLEEPEMRFWFLDDDWIKPYLPQLEEARTSRLVLNPLQKEERIAAIVQETVRSVFSGENANVFARRMEDIALYFLRTGRAESAKLALAVAQQLLEGGPGPLDVSFLTELVRKSFAFYTSEEKKKTEEEPSFIVKP